MEDEVKTRNGYPKTRLHPSQLVFNLLHYSSLKPFNPSNRNHPLSSILVTTLIFLSFRKETFSFFRQLTFNIFRLFFGRHFLLGKKPIFP